MTEQARWLNSIYYTLWHAETFYQWIVDVACTSSKCFWKELWSIYQYDHIYLVSLLQNYSPQYESYDVKAGVAGGGLAGYPGPVVCTSVSQHFRTLFSLPVGEISNGGSSVNPVLLQNCTN